MTTYIGLSFYPTTTYLGPWQPEFRKKENKRIPQSEVSGLVKGLGFRARVNGGEPGNPLIRLLHLSLPAACAPLEGGGVNDDRKQALRQ